MAAIEKFKQQIREGKLFDAFALVVSEASELQITTRVSAAYLETQSIIAQDELLSNYYFRTRINLVNGEINNEISDDIIGNKDYTELQKLHQEQVQQSREIVLKNLESLQKMFFVLNNTLGHLRNESYPKGILRQIFAYLKSMFCRVRAREIRLQNPPSNIQSVEQTTFSRSDVKL